jgi:hypothetical protein
MFDAWPKDVDMRASLFLKICTAILVSLFLLACSRTATQAKTEVLPDDGGDLGKAFLELSAALKAADKDRVGKLLDPNQWHLADKDPSWFKQFDRFGDAHPTGGRRQGDRATLFLESGTGTATYYSMSDATRTASGWQFDSPMSFGSSFGDPLRDCGESTLFPCAETTAPDNVVSGSVTPHSAGRISKSDLPPIAMFDGLAARMLEPEGDALKSTFVLLAGKGINPRMVAQSHDPDHVAQWLGYPIVKLDIAGDGKSAKVFYYDGVLQKRFDVADGLNIEPGVANRIRGRLKTDVKDVALLDLKFDLGTASVCHNGEYNCGK